MMLRPSASKELNTENQRRSQWGRQKKEVSIVGVPKGAVSYGNQLLDQRVSDLIRKMRIEEVC